MPAYVIVEIEEVTDSTILDRYRAIAAASVAKHGVPVPSLLWQV